MLVKQYTRHQYNAKNDRFTCTPKHPMPKGAEGRWEHTNAHEIDCGSDYCARYKCDDCGHEWTEELPE